MVKIQTSGMAVSFQESTEDQSKVNMIPNGSPNSLILPRLRAFQRTTSELPPYARRLQKLLGGVRRTFGGGDYTIEWADDGEICWLIQITN